MKKLNLEILSDSTQTGLSPRYGAFMAEGATVCLASHNHPVTVDMQSEGHFPFKYEVTGIQLHPNAVSSFGDMQEATEYGAMGIAVALVCSETGLQVVRSPKDGGGFDFYVGEKDENFAFHEKARLEVSGILKNTRKHTENRLKEKMEQSKVSDVRKISAYGIVVEFSEPLTLTGKR